MKLAPLIAVERCDQKFLLRFPYNTSVWKFSCLETTSYAVDFSRAETALLPDQENAIVLADKTERCSLLRLPVRPVHCVWRLAFRVWRFAIRSY